MNALELLRAAAIVLGAGALAAAAIWLLRRAAALLPADRSRRRSLRRALPLAEVAIVLAALAWIAVLAAGAQPGLATGALLGVIAVALAAAWFAIRDLVAGAVLRAENLFETGEWVRSGALEGRVERVGTRSLDIEAEDGSRVRIPWSVLAAAPLARAVRADAVHSHRFTVQLDGDVPPLAAAERIRRAALESHYASATREPHVRHRTDVQEHDAGPVFEVTVYSPERRFFPEIEREVRERLQAG
jgi:small-conductance mechanosensitive channel